MSSSGSTTIWASDYDLGSYDDCSNVDLYFKGEDGSYVSSITLNCNDFNEADGIWEGMLYAVDEYQNESACQISLAVSNTSTICGNTFFANVSGSVYTFNETDIEGVQLDINQSERLTDKYGAYAFEAVNMYQDYELLASKNDDHLNGISVIDIVLIQQHIL